MNKEKGRGGIVISIASIAGLDGYYAMPTYSATKHAVVGFNECYSVSKCCSLTSCNTFFNQNT